MDASTNPTIIPLMPHQPVAPKNRHFARSMRKEPTKAEDKLWQELRDRRLDKLKFRRQVPIGNYIVDFLCLEAKLIVEIDGSSMRIRTMIASATRF